MISIVSAYFNRKKLLVNTLNSLSKSTISDFEFIVVDDCSDEENRLEDLCEIYPFLKIVRINPSEKWYVNPCVPFNIGFKQAKGDIIIIQNPECYHYDDILSYVCANIKEDDYLSFSCYALSREETENLQESLLQDNLKIYYGFTDEGVLANGDGWYNHSVYRPVGYHFCSAIYKTKLDDLGGFDERYAKGVTYDDNELLERIKRMGLNIKIIDSVKVLHQWHPSFNYNQSNLSYLQQINYDLFHNVTLKEKNYKANFIEIIEKNDLNIFVLGYNFPHKKTQEGLYKLIQNNIKIDYVILADSIELKFRPSKTRVGLKDMVYEEPKNICERFGIPYLVMGHNSSEFEDLLSLSQPDLGVILGSRIIKNNIIQKFKIGILNLHPGILPDNRGLDNIKWAIFKKMKQGVTSHLIDSKIDMGILIDQVIVNIYEDDSLTDIFLRVQNRELELMISSIDKIKKGFTSSNKLGYGNYFKPMTDDEDLNMNKMFENYKKIYEKL